MTWLYCGKPFDPPENAYGFVYIIYCKENQKSYIGRKYLTKAAYKQVNGKKKKIRKPSDWESYWGSNEELKADIKKYGKKSFSREILYVCETRGMTNYMELREIIDRRALESPDFYNSWVSAKVHRSTIKFFNTPSQVA